MPGVAASLMQQRAIQSALLTLHFLGQHASARARVLTCSFESGAVGEFFSQFCVDFGCTCELLFGRKSSHIDNPGDMGVTGSHFLPAAGRLGGVY